MRSRLATLVRYYMFWVALFAAARLLFLWYHHARTARLGAGTIAGIVLHGARMDLSAAAYIAVLPALFLAASSWLASRIARRIIAVYSVVMIVFVALLTTIDLELYTAWGFRLDATPLQYLSTPREMIASAESSPIFTLLAIFILLVGVAVVAYRRLVGRQTAEEGGGIATFAGVLGVTAFLIVPIRGGLQWTPLNQSSVYFSTSDFANQAALNVGWNVFRSLTTRGALERENPYTELDAATSLAVVDSLLRVADSSAPSLLRVPRPNVILIIWESLTAKVVGRLGGVPGVTPHLDSLSHEGVLFDQVYASGDRSAKGLVAILSGFPAQPRVQVMHTPKKAAKLPSLARDLGAEGYATAFYYGGELEFANIKSYVIGGRFEHVVGEDAFDPHDRNSKWGAHDHVVLQRVLAETSARPRPFFTTVFTLSSHEPFEVPIPPAFPGNDVRSKFLSAHAYTDRSVGAFIRAAQREPWWDSTLVVIVADHGHMLPSVDPGDGEEVSVQYHIPMVWLGGALAVRDTVVTRIGSQTDLAPTLLAQLHLPHAQYRWGRNILAPDAAPFAYFPYLDGFGVVDARGRLVYDALARRVMQRTGGAGEPEVRSGLAFLRLSYQDYLDK
jgi:phosphoglycerol transferase MdoB-like AlkP superfamily enzyme